MKSIFKIVASVVIGFVVMVGIFKVFPTVQEPTSFVLELQISDTEHYSVELSKELMDELEGKMGELKDGTITIKVPMNGVDTSFLVSFNGDLTAPKFIFKRI